MQSAAQNIKSIIVQFQKYGAEICFDRLDVTSLTKIIMSGAAKRGCNIDRETAAYLIETSGKRPYDSAKRDR